MYSTQVVNLHAHTFSHRKLVEDKIYTFLYYKKSKIITYKLKKKVDLIQYIKYFAKLLDHFNIILFYMK